jgi:predicted nuclease of restriction endonuclease-like (RecB) superfamily
VDKSLTVKLEDEFSHVLQIISERRSRASQFVNSEVLASAWEVGSFVSSRLKSAQWGSKTVTQLSEFIKVQKPLLKGYSRANIYNMIALYDFYSSSDFHSFLATLGSNHRLLEFVQPLAGQISNVRDVGVNSTQQDIQIFQPAAGIFDMPLTEQIPALLNLTTFTNHIEIINHCDTMEERLFYVFYAWKERLNKRELQRCFTTDRFAAFARDSHSFSKSLKTTYPQAPRLFKDEVFLDFLGLPNKHSESKLRSGIVDHVKEFILELGKDFIFIDEHHPLNVGGKVFKLDLLFFHRGLQCLVGIELKSGEFKPKDLGQLEFYLEALDRDVKRSNENPSIGILLCRDANRSVVEYALSRSLSPTMIAKYKRLLVPKEVLRKSLEDFGALLPDEEQENNANSK